MVGFSNHGDVCNIFAIFGRRRPVKVDAKSGAILFNIATSLFFIASTGLKCTKEFPILHYKDIQNL